MAERNLNHLYNAATNAVEQGAVMHIRFAGNSRDVPFEALRVNHDSSDGAIRTAVASFLDVAESLLNNLVIERHPNGNMTLRPEAVFG
jgi:hypothetical protein